MEALAKLGIDFKVLIAQFINFGILFLLLSYFLYRPIQKILEERRQKIKESLELAEEIKKKHNFIKEQSEAIITHANKKADNIINEAKTEAEKLRHEIILKAENDAQEIISEASRKIAQERESIMKESKKSAGALAIFIVTKILKINMNEEMLKRSVDTALTEINK